MAFSVEILLFLMAVAFVAGVIDAMAGGGGLITIPALLAAGVPPVAALATNKLQSCFGTATAFFTYWRGGHVDLKRFALPAVAAFVGSMAGAITVQHIDSGFLSALVPIMLVVMGLYFLLAPPMGTLDREPRLGSVGLTLLLAGIGFYDGFFGPGTGSFFTTALIALAGLGLVRAIANTKFLNLATNLAAMVAMVIGGHVVWIIGFSMAGANIVGSSLGARFAMRFGGRGVRPLLVILSVGLTVRLLADPENPFWTLFG